MSVSREDYTKEFLSDVERVQLRFVTQGGIEIENEMKRRAPVDLGNLRRSITSTVDRDAGGLYSEIGPGTDYAEWVEYGTTKMEAQPYAEPGFQAGKQRIDARAARELKT